MKQKADLAGTMEIITKWAVNLAIASTTIKILMDAYDENPAMFQCYLRESFKSKHRDILFNVRM